MRFLCSALLSAAAVCAPAAPVQDPLLDHLAGAWVLQGTIASRATTHEVRAEWVLGHQYLQLSERSRELDAQGAPQYEAIVLIGREPASGAYQILWLDSTAPGGLTPEGLGAGARKGDSITFLWRDRDGSLSFDNTFAYDPGADAWTWSLDNIQGGRHQPFARLKLTRAARTGR